MKINWKNRFWALHHFLRFKVQGGITWLGLYSLIFLVIYKSPTENVITISLVILGIIIASAQTVFSYIPLIEKEEERKIIQKAGEHLMLAGMWLSIGLLVLYVAINWEPLIKVNGNFNILVNALKIIALLNFSYVADSVNKAINRIGYILWWKVDI